MPHKCLITHRVKHGHYKEVKKWFFDEDKKRKEKIHSTNRLGDTLRSTVRPQKWCVNSI